MIISWFLLGGVARGQSVDTLSPAGGAAFGRGSPQLEAPVVARRERAVAVFGSLGEDAGSPQDSPVELLFPMVVVGSVAVGDRVRFDLQVPFYPQVRTTGWSGAAFGDVRLRGLVAIAGDERLGFALLPTVGLPTGMADALVARGPSGGLAAVTGGTSERAGWTTNLGFTAAPGRDLPGGTMRTGSTVDLGAATWAGRPSFRAGVEGGASIGLGASSAGMVDVFAQTRHASGVGLAVSGGGGFGYGADTRLIAVISYARQDVDGDRDGVLDAADGCPEDPEDRDGWEDDDGCPDPDDDGDGVVDVDDGCARVPEDADGYQDADGCPDPDNDGDTVVDAVDRCPDVAGPVAQHGCTDADGDGLDDAADACPGQPGPSDEQDPDGCPKSAWIATNGRIEATAPIAFELAGTLTPEAAQALDAVAALLRSHPEITSLEIGAHVHTGYPEAEGFALSRVRATRVRTALIERGVEESRLVAHGYGATRPIDTNRTTAGRAKNERIELVIEPAPPP